MGFVRRGKHSIEIWSAKEFSAEKKLESYSCKEREGWGAPRLPATK